MKKLIVLLIVVAFCGSTFAANIWWNGSVSDDWGTAANWNGGIVPVAADHAMINLVPAGNFDLLVDGPSIVATWSMGWHGSNEDVIVAAGGDFQGTGQAHVGNFAGTAGSSTAVCNLYVQTGGSAFGAGLQLGGTSGSVGNVHIDGGTVTTGWLTVRNTSMVDINSGGQFIITDIYQPLSAWITAVDAWIASGVITADDGASTPTYSIVDGGGVAGAGSIVVVPEPATMMLLGLGGLLIRRKRA